MKKAGMSGTDYDMNLPGMQFKKTSYHILFISEGYSAPNLLFQTET